MKSSRERILEVAERLFADQGFRKVTVRDISHAAGVNLAAVNYHFGDKLGLYEEVLRGATEKMRETTETARREHQGLPAEERLRRYVALFVGRLLAAGAKSNIQRLVRREMHDPTPALDGLLERGVRPRLEYLAGLVSEITGRPASDPSVMRSVFSIQAQSLACVPNAIGARLGFAPGPADAEAIARHIADFSMEGLRGLRLRPRRPSRGGTPRRGAGRARPGQRRVG